VLHAAERYFTGRARSHVTL